MYRTKISLLAALALTSIMGVYSTETLLEVEKDVKIVGGRETTIQKHPYQVHLEIKLSDIDYTSSCGGSIVNSRCVLTAAHCLNGIESIVIRAGSSKSNSGGTTYNSRMFMQHPKYNRTTKDYDLAIIRLTTSIKLDGKYTSTINFPSSNCTVTPGTNLTVSGWGAEEEGEGVTTNLREVSVDALDFDDCKTKYRRLTSRMLCAGVPEGGKDACQGDSGGPLVRTGTKDQVGIVSFGRGCARAEYPGVYTNLCNSDIQNWLKEMKCA